MYKDSDRITLQKQFDSTRDDDRLKSCGGTDVHNTQHTEFIVLHLVVNIITTSLSTVNKVPCTRSRPVARPLSTQDTNSNFDVHPRPRLGTESWRACIRAPDHVTSVLGLVVTTLLQHEPRYSPQDQGPEFRRIPGAQPANGACACYAGHATPLSPPLLIAINGPDTWIYYCIEIVIYDVSLTAHELTSRGHFGSR